MTREATCLLRMPNMEHLFGQIEANAKRAKRMARVGTHVGKSVGICGAGPTLADTWRSIPNLDEVWACNSALPYMRNVGARVTHGFCIDQGVEMLKDWARTHPVHYYLSSSVHPSLERKLRTDGRSITWFHSFLGIPNPEGWTDGSYEMWLYTHRFPESVQVGHGLNSVPRAVCLAIAMGFSRIVVYGADCAFRPDGPPMPLLDSPEYAGWLRQLVMYADGRSPAVFGDDAVMCEATVGGRRWHTRPDMVISARHLLDLVRDYPAVELVGDTLPNALAAAGPGVLDNLPRLSETGRITGFAAAV